MIVCYQYKVTSHLGGLSFLSTPPISIPISWSKSDIFVNASYLDNVGEKYKVSGHVGEEFWVDHYQYEPICAWKIKQKNPTHKK